MNLSQAFSTFFLNEMIVKWERMKCITPQKANEYDQELQQSQTTC